MCVCVQTLSIGNWLGGGSASGMNGQVSDGKRIDMAGCVTRPVVLLRLCVSDGRGGVCACGKGSGSMSYGCADNAM